MMYMLVPVLANLHFWFCHLKFLVWDSVLELLHPSSGWGGLYPFSSIFWFVCCAVTDAPPPNASPHSMYLCWFPYPHFYITGNAPYGTGNATHTGNVRCPYRLCMPFCFTSFLANALCYVPFWCACLNLPVWKSRKLQYWYCHCDVPRQYRSENPENYSTGTSQKLWEVTNTIRTIFQDILFLRTFYLNSTCSARGNVS